MDRASSNEDRLREIDPPMTIALASAQALRDGADGHRLKVNVGGRLLEISPEGSVSVVLLRRELINLLNVCSSSSLQVMDSSGRQVVRTDEDLMSAVREHRVPLQAKLTTSALHEIEQKKREAETKKEELLNYQWQVVIEQIAVLSGEVRSATSQIQTFKDECDKNVQQFNEREELRRAQLMQVIREETSARELGEREMNAKIEAFLGHINTERSARDVADSQLAHRIEQVAAEINSERSDRARAEEEIHRLYSQLRHEVSLEAQKAMEYYANQEKALKRLDEMQNDHQTVKMSQQSRISALEAEAERMRSSLSTLETTVQVQARAAQDGIVRTADELDRARREAAWGRGNDVNQLAKNLEIYERNVEVRLQKVREEAMDGRLALEERSQVMEQRCAKLEKEVLDRHASDASKEQQMLDRINTALACVDNVLVAQKAADVVVETSSSQIAELEEQLRTCNDALRERTRTDHIKPVIDSLQQVLHMQESKIGSLERDVQTRFVQEQQHRDALRIQVHDSVKKAFEKLTVKFQEMSMTESRSRGSSPSPNRMSAPVTPPPRATSSSHVPDRGDFSDPPAPAAVCATAPTVRPLSHGQGCESRAPEEDAPSNACQAQLLSAEADGYVLSTAAMTMPTMPVGQPMAVGAPSRATPAMTAAFIPRTAISGAGGAFVTPLSARSSSGASVGLPVASGGGSLGLPVPGSQHLPTRTATPVRSLSAQRVRAQPSQPDNQPLA
mmetsp:Transcript_46826/g.111408  ORF Transcript_46826/g.111408 Transcript_46826/m.111408 type:complete len:734 (+) Transcript_46826:112-2313(+)